MDVSSSDAEKALALSGSSFGKFKITVEKAKAKGQKEANKSFNSPGGGGDASDSKLLFFLCILMYYVCLLYKINIINFFVVS